MFMELIKINSYTKEYPLKKPQQTKTNKNKKSQYIWNTVDFHY